LKDDGNDEQTSGTKADGGQSLSWDLYVDPDRHIEFSPRILARVRKDISADRTKSLEDYLQQMLSSYREFRAALKLYEISRDMMQVAVPARTAARWQGEWSLPYWPVWNDWQHLAAKQGAVSVRNFGQAMTAAQALAGSEKALLELLDPRIGGRAIGRFKQSFPGIDQLRHAVVHPEYYPNPKKKGTSINGGIPEAINAAPGATVEFTGLVRDKYTITFDGEVQQCDISGATELILKEILEEYFSMFEPAAAFTK
jgi:hypothetical protein